MVKQRVSYFYDTDAGHFYYGPGHPMKPHRIKMAHHLILSTGLYRKLDVYRPHLAAPLEMTRFHSDDYVKFLSKVSPESTRPFLQQMAQFNVGECTDCPVRARRPVVLWCFHFIQTTRVHLTMPGVVSFSSLSAISHTGLRGALRISTNCKWSVDRRCGQAESRRLRRGD